MSRARTSFTALVEDYLTDAKVRRVSRRTIEEYRYALRPFLTFLQRSGVRRIESVTLEILAVYRKHVLGRVGPRGPLGAGSRANLISRVRLFFAYLVRQGRLMVNPARLLELPPAPPRPPTDILSVRDVERLLRAPDVTRPLGVRDRAMLELLYSTGLRVTELIELAIDDVDLAGGVLTVRRRGGGPSRQIPVGAEACLWISRYLGRVRHARRWRRSVPALFVSQRGLKLERKVVSALIRDHARRASVRQRVTTHTLRHTFATHMLRGGADVRHVQQMLGHARLKTTQVYTRAVVTDLKDVYGRCHPRGRG